MNFLTTFKKMLCGGIQTQKLCLLCGKEEETMGHLYFNREMREYTRHLLLSTSEALNSAVWRNQNKPIPNITGGDIIIGHIIEAIEKFTTKAGLGSWRYTMVPLGSLAWHVWSKRNREAQAAHPEGIGDSKKY